MNWSVILKKLCYTKIIPKGLLRILDDFLLLPAMWFPSSALRIFFNRLRGVNIGKDVWIGHGSLLGQHPFLLTIGNNVKIAGGVKMLTHDASFTCIGGKDLAGIIKIGNNVHIGENVIILPGVNIEDNSIISANSVVNADIPSGTIAFGIPAKPVLSVKEGLEKLETKLKSKRYFSTW